MSFGLSTTPTYRIRAMTAHPIFPVKLEDSDNHFQYAVHMQGRLGLKSTIQPRRTRSASPRRSRASIGYEMMRSASQKVKPPPHDISRAKGLNPRCRSQNTQRDKIVQPRRNCHSAQTVRSAQACPESGSPKTIRSGQAFPRSKSPRRPRSAMTAWGVVRSKSHTDRPSPPTRPKSAFVRRRDYGTQKSLGGREDRVRSVTFLNNDGQGNEQSSTRALPSEVSEAKKPGSSGLWAKGMDLVHRKSSGGDNLRKPSSKFLELVLKMRDGSGKRKSPALYLRPFERFQRVAHAVKLLMGFCIHLKRCASSNANEEWSFMEYHINLEAELNQLMAFRMEQYTNRNSRKDRGSEKLKQLLVLDPEKRTDRDIYIISALIKSNEAFQEYPNWMQQKLCRNFYYRSFEARRVLYKEGHVPHYFYILLTGTVMMNVKEYNKETEKTFSHTISQVNEGQSFGEHAMLADTSRKTTAICKTAVELLVLHQTDFDEIIKIPLQTQRQNHVTFIRSLELFHDFPMELLEDRAHIREFFYQYFKKGSVVVKNNLNYKFLVIIKSGRCNIIVEYKNALKRTMADIPKLTETDEELFPIMCDRMRHTLVERASQMTLDLQRDHVRGLMMKSLMPDIAGMAKKLALEKELRKKGLEDSLDSLQHIPEEGENIPADFEEKAKKLLDEKKEELLTPFSIGAAVARTGAGGSARRKKEEEASMARESVQTGKKRVSDDKEEEEEVKVKTGMSIHDLPGEYARIATLKAGSVFGLETLFESASQEAELPLILSSEGAECLIISKKLFLNGANARVLQVVSDMVVGWPSVEFVGQKIKEHRDWQTYKQYVINDVMKHTRRKSRVMSAHI